MHNMVAIGIFFVLLFAGIGIMLAGLGVYYWGKGNEKKIKTSKKVKKGNKK